ncbi:glucocorticoid receptor [Polypterus senegalus]|uniref:glucocorticoid receptor n=1 Tax=Polypterus senegalus TaxID=55291 RepID=UPI00196363F8|nr:glucocorticoid receptor [Polypterus senegalus]XP_039631109.1 glucocorticoid receptor [Polypterus senegalus]XP_039631110.1 glucocorticoid receptor [Polypterus senegalus]XP_039631111.1 glucocorticoid receptor [Polypterus senegalus]
MSSSTEVTLSQNSSQQRSVSGDVLNGIGSKASTPELSTAVSASMGLFLEDSDLKVTGSMENQPLLVPSNFSSGETNFSLLDESIAKLNRSSGDSGLLEVGAGSFSQKADDLIGIDKSGLPLDPDTFGKDSDSNQRIFDDQNTLDILQDLDLPISPKTEMNGSPWNLNAFYEGDDNALLSPLVAEDPFLTDLPVGKDCKPFVSNGNNITGVSLPSSSSPSVKLEKDGYIHLFTPGVIKQEMATTSYCQISNLTPDRSSPLNSPISVCGVSTSGGQTYHFGVTSSSVTNLQQQQDQKPIFKLLPFSTVAEPWNRSEEYRDSAGNTVGNQGCSAVFVSAAASCASSTSGKSTGPVRKICLVCSDEASGCHYGVLTCGSCKVFFKRAVEGQHNYLCAGRNDCIIDKIRRKNCPACRFRKCLQAGMNLEARKTKKLSRLKGVQTNAEHVAPLPNEQPQLLVPKSVAQLTPSMLSLLRAIEPETPYSGYDSSLPDSSSRFINALNHLGARQLVAAVKWAKALPGFKSLHIDDQMVLLQYSWLFLVSFSLGWRSYHQSNANSLYFAPDLILHQDGMNSPIMVDQYRQMLKIANELLRLQVSHDEFLCMKVLLLLSTVPKEGLRSQKIFDDLRMTYIRELGRAIVKREENSSQNWQRFYQLTKLLDNMHELVGGLLSFCFYTFLNKTLSVEYPEMLAEIISHQIPKFKAGNVKALMFHQK